jgi:hypothetical protein
MSAPNCFQAEEALAAIEQCLGLARYLGTVQQYQGTTVVIHALDVENAFNEAVAGKASLELHIFFNK